MTRQDLDMRTLRIAPAEWSCSICEAACGRTIIACMAASVGLERVRPGHYETTHGHEVRKRGSLWYFRLLCHDRDPVGYDTLRGAAAELYRALQPEVA